MGVEIPEKNVTPPVTSKNTTQGTIVISLLLTLKHWKYKHKFENALDSSLTQLTPRGLRPAAGEARPHSAR